MEWYNTFDSVFWLSISTGVFGFLAIVVKYGFKSKCDRIRFCSGEGCISIHRSVELELSDIESSGNEGGISKKI
jgi:hypothetical protein